MSKRLITFDSKIEWSDKYYHGFSLNKLKSNIKYNFEPEDGSYYIVKFVSCIREFKYSKEKIKNTNFPKFEYVFKITVEVIHEYREYPFDLLVSMNLKKMIRDGRVVSSYNKSYVEKVTRQYFIDQHSREIND